MVRDSVEGDHAREHDLATAAETIDGMRRQGTEGDLQIAGHELGVGGNLDIARLSTAHILVQSEGIVVEDHITTDDVLAELLAHGGAAYRPVRAES